MNSTTHLLVLVVEPFSSVIPWEPRTPWASRRPPRGGASRCRTCRARRSRGTSTRTLSCPSCRAGSTRGRSLRRHRGAPGKCRSRRTSHCTSPASWSPGRSRRTFRHLRASSPRACTRTACPNACSGHGQCANGVNLTLGSPDPPVRCVCDVAGSGGNKQHGFRGDFCDQSCLTDDTTGQICSGHGTCRTGIRCECDNGYFGPSCEFTCTDKVYYRHTNTNKTTGSL